MRLLGDIDISVVNVRLFKSSLGPATTLHLVQRQWMNCKQVASANRIRLDGVHCQHWNRREVCPSPLIRVSFSSRVRSTRTSARPRERKHDFLATVRRAVPRGGLKRSRDFGEPSGAMLTKTIHSSSTVARVRLVIAIAGVLGGAACLEEPRCEETLTCSAAVLDDGGAVRGDGNADEADRQVAPTDTAPTDTAPTDTAKSTLTRALSMPVEMFRGATMTAALMTLGISTVRKTPRKRRLHLATSPNRRRATVASSLPTWPSSCRPPVSTVRQERRTRL